MSRQSDRNSQSSHPLLSCGDGLAATWQDFLLLLGRVLMGWIFLQSGWGKIFNFAGNMATYPARGLPSWLAYIAVPTEFLGGLFLIVGFATRYTAVVMLIFVVVASFSSHAYWTSPEAQRATQSSQFWKNIAILGGLVFLYVTAAGRYSVDGMLGRSKN